MWIGVILVLGCVIPETLGNTECPHLYPGPNMVLSAVEGFIGDQPVTVTCNDGYKLDMGTVEKQVACLLVKNVAQWNDSLGTCQLKTCPPIDTILTSTMSPAAAITHHVGDRVNVTCLDGHVFSINHAVSGDGRLSDTAVAVCKNDPNGVNGTWSKIGNCTVIVCDIPPNLPNAILNYTDLSWNATVIYTCLSGTSVHENVYTLLATCNRSANWETVYGYDLHLYQCSEDSRYIGCLSNGTLDVSSQTEPNNNGLEACVKYCMTSNARYAGIQNSTCFCGDRLIPGYTSEKRSACSQRCPDYDVTDVSTQAFCGGPAGLIDVYLTLDGCYDGLITTGLSPFPVPEAVESTCSEMCRARDNTHAVVYSGYMCACLNVTSSISSSLIRVRDAKCRNTTANAVFNITDLDGSPVWAVNCSSLYESGIRVRGEYYLKAPARREHCYFKDGTVCEEGWIGYHGNCYYFHNDTTLNYSDARQRCMSQNAELVSILSEDEYKFLADTRTMFPDLKPDVSVSEWWIGMIDVMNTSIYTWLDGNMRTFSKFTREPHDPFTSCAQDKATHYEWSESSCEHVKNVMCKKTAGPTPYCVSMITIPTGIQAETRADMSLSFCAQFCKGQQTDIMMLRNTTCLCDVTLPAHMTLNVTDCDLECAGNEFQFCGGNDINVFSVRNVTEVSAARSCEELQLISIDNSTFAVQPEDSLEYHYCGEAACEYGWVILDGHCYKFNMIGETSSEAVTECSKHDAYTVTIETVEEMERVLAAATNISIYSSEASWRLGMQALSMNGGQFVWANGRWPNIPAVTIAGKAGPTVTVGISNHALWTATVDKDHVYICEKSEDYYGCYGNDGVTMMIEDYNQMTIQQCVETCRAQNYTMAFVNSTFCACAYGTSGLNRPGECSSTCSGQDNQICGGTDGAMSVYNISAYPALASSCMELFYKGIFFSGEYLIGGNLQTCKITDGGACTRGWISIGGSCYKHFPVSAHHSHAKICREYDAVLTSVHSSSEYHTLMAYLARTNFHGKKTKAFSGIKSGLYGMGLFISADGILTDLGLITTQALPSRDLRQAPEYISFSHDVSETYADGGVVCKVDKYRIGCFDLPNNLVNVKLRDFPSIELSLCRQLCISAERPVFLVGKDFCACVNESDVTAMVPNTSHGCKEPCLIHSDQMCGNGSVIWAYHTDNTTCPPGWLGYQGACIKFSDVSLTFKEARNICATTDSFLFNPYIDFTTNFVQGFFNESGLFDDADEFFTGLFPVTFNTSYTASDGQVGYTNFASETEIPVLATVYRKSTQQWVAGPNKALFVCQLNEGYLGCKTITSPPDFNFTKIANNSLTQCAQLCIGSEANYSATSRDTCLCFNDAPVMSSSSGKCSLICDGNPAQICGGTDGDKQTFNVINIMPWEGITGTCSDVFRFGMSHPGRYLLRYNVTEPFIKTRCFMNPPSLSHVTDVKSIWATTSLSGYPASDVMYKHGWTHAWKPKVDSTSQSVTIILADEYLITSLTFKGMHTSIMTSFLTSYGLRYRDHLSEELVSVNVNESANISTGCESSTDQCLTIFTDPFVTSELRVQPLTWSSSIALQLAIGGQRFSEFNHTETYVGCHPDYGNKFINTNNVLNVPTCIALCKDTHKQPYSSIDVSGNCWCGTVHELGFVEEDNCALNASTSRRYGTGLYRALHRTYHKHCEDPDIKAVYRGNLTAVKHYSGSEVHMFMTSLNYTCDVGYEASLGVTVQQSFCRQNNTWSALKNCTIISCPSFNVTNGNVTFTSLTYGSQAVVECEQGFWAENGQTTMSVTCQHNKTWTIEPTCAVDNLKKKQRRFLIKMSTIRNASGADKEVMARGRLDCATKCAIDYYCRGANFRETSGSGGATGTCRLFLNDTDGSDLSTDPEWKYLEVM